MSLFDILLLNEKSTSNANILVDCRTCIFVDCYIGEIYKYDYFGKPLYQIGEQYIYGCRKKYINIHKFKRQCNAYISLYQRYITTSKGGDNMVKLEQIPTEKERVDLSKLPTQNVLKAVSEKLIAPEPNKAGGLEITFAMVDGVTFPQKYTKIAGKALGEALTQLGLTDTEDLQKSYYRYTMTTMRMGFPRYIPFEKVEDTEITTKRKR